jgi:hypothetical protein
MFDYFSHRSWIYPAFLSRNSMLPVLLRLGESLLCEEQFNTASFVRNLAKGYTLAGLSSPKLGSTAR